MGEGRDGKIGPPGPPGECHAPVAASVAASVAVARANAAGKAALGGTDLGNGERVKSSPRAGDRLKANPRGEEGRGWELILGTGRG